MCFKLLELFNNNSTELHVWYVTQHDTQEPESRTEIAKLDSRRGLSSFCGNVAENVSMIMMTVHKICFLRCCSNPTHRHRVWVSAKQCQTGYRKTMHFLPPFIEWGIKVFQMFRALPYLKSHLVPGLLLPSNGKVAMSKILPCLNKFKQHRDTYKEKLVGVCM